MKLPKWLYQFSYQREPIWIFVYILVMPLSLYLFTLVFRLAR